MKSIGNIIKGLGGNLAGPASQGFTAAKWEPDDRWLECRIEQFKRLCPQGYADTDEARLAAPADYILRMPFPMDGKGLLLTGPAGTGKTRTAWMTLRRWMLSRPFSVLAYNGIAFARSMGDSYAQGHSGDWHDAVETVKVLLLDDLFKARMTPALADTIYSVLEARHSWRRPTIITMNAVGESISQALPEDMRAPVIRRILESSHLFEFRSKPREAT